MKITDARFSLLEDHINDLRKFVFPMKETISKELLVSLNGKILPEIELINLKLNEQENGQKARLEETQANTNSMFEDLINEIKSLRAFTLSHKGEVGSRKFSLYFITFF